MPDSRLQASKLQLSVALSSDGETLAVGCPYWDRELVYRVATDQYAGSNNGRVRLFKLRAGDWVETRRYGHLSNSQLRHHLGQFRTPLLASSSIPPHGKSFIMLR